MESRPSVKADQRDESPVRFGILSTAMINPAGLIHPAETHPGVVINGIASRDIKNSQSAASAYKIKKAYGSYDDLLGDDEIDAVYISLPNGMHSGTILCPPHPEMPQKFLTASRMGRKGGHRRQARPP